MSRVPLSSNAGLYSATSNPASAESDLWYRSDKGQPYMDFGTNSGSVGPNGSHALPVSGVTDAWYSLQPGGGAHSSAAVTDNLPYTYPLWPGRKTSLTGIRARVSVAVLSGDIRAVLWAPGGNGFPDARIVDYGTVTATVAGVVSWAGVNTALEPIPYWLSIIPQTGLVLSMSRYTTFNPMVPWIAASPAMGTADYWNCITGPSMAGAAPPNFGAVAGIALGPHIMVKFS